ncbi:MAG TPA: hypothetical protein VGZ48_01020 [Candidatus Acidoferrales bacterium]|nr:hypothetical protein [Candidatus Acidoferrales bacterium]
MAGLGVIQSFTKNDFLNPTDIAPELYDLSHDIRQTPQSHLLSTRPTSVFVSDGRFGMFLFLFFILAFGTSVYLSMRGKKGRALVFLTLGIVVLASVMTGSRTTFMYMILDAVVLAVALLWGAPIRQRKAFRLGKAIRWAVSFAAVAILLTVVFFPEAIYARWAMYAETLSPTSQTSELGYRGWEYPATEFNKIFTQQNWEYGNGIGTASLGRQYVTRLVDAPNLLIGTESGYGALVAEFGVAGPILWMVWTIAVVVYAWKVVRKLKKTAFFTIGFAIFWYAFMLLIPTTFYGIAGYQNYLTNAYLWLTLGMLFRLPGLLAEQQAAAAAAARDAHAT